MSKQVLKTGTFTFNGTVYGVTSMEMAKVAEEVDLTDTQTPGNEREYLAGRQERTFTIETWKDVAVADPSIGDLQAGVIDFEGYTYAGDMVLLTITPNAAIDDGVAQTYEGRFSGAIVETPATP